VTIPLDQFTNSTTHKAINTIKITSLQLFRMILNKLMNFEREKMEGILFKASLPLWYRNFLAD